MAEPTHLSITPSEERKGKSRSPCKWINSILCVTSLTPVALVEVNAC